jgi:colanic acid biosynthesis glycosyl transferase WcaI
MRRIIHEASFIVLASLRAAATGWGQKPDLLFVVSPPLGLGLSAVLLSRLWNVPYVFHVADLQPDAAVDLGMLPDGRIIQALYALERLAYRKAAAVSTLTEAIRRRITSKEIAAEKVALFSDWAAPGLFELPITDGGQEFRREFGLENRFIVMHAGNMGVKQGLEVVLEAADFSRNDPEIVYLLVGDGAARASLEKTANARRLSNVRFIPLQKEEVFRQMLAAVDICLVTQRKSVADIVFPSKVLTLLAAGKAVIASVAEQSEVARVVTEAGCGIKVPPEDPYALHNAVLDLRSNAGLRGEMGTMGRVYARQHWDRERVLRHTEAELLKAAGRTSGVQERLPRVEYV